MPNSSTSTGKHRPCAAVGSWAVTARTARFAQRSVCRLKVVITRKPFALADLDVEWDLPRGPMYRFDWSAGTRPKASLAAVPIRGSARHYRLSIIVPEEQAAALANTPSPDFDTMRAVLQPALPDGTRLSSMRWSSVYRVSHRIVPAYSRGRVFIAGDAAHIHPPVGGQGMNTGLQDAHNLAWKLSLAAKGPRAA